MDLISIIIPVYNTGKYLTGCLDSCLKQTYTNLEIIVIDDCSTDSLTIEILNKYKDIDPRLKVVFNQENRGQGFCRNEGLKYIHGKYFAYIDSDDTFVPDAIEQLHEAIVHYKTDFVQSDVHNINAEDVFSDNDGFVPSDINDRCRDRFNFNGQENVVFNLPELNENGLLFNVPALCYGKIFNTESYLKAQILFDDGPYSRHCQDEDWSTQMLLKLKSFVFIKFVSIVRFILKNSASTPSLNYYKSALAACARRFKLLDQPNLPAFYKYSVLSFALERTRMLLSQASHNTEYRPLCQLATEFLDSYRPLLHGSVYPAYILPLFETYTVQSMLTYAYPERPYLCYFSMQNLFDTTDSEVLAVRSVLEHLVACGFKICTLSGLLTKSAKGNSLFEKLTVDAKHNKLAHSFKDMPGIRHFFQNGINHYGVDLSYNILGQDTLQSPHDVSALTNAVKTVFASQVPDILLASGTDQTTWSMVNALAQTCAKVLALASNSNTKANQSSSSIPVVYIPLHESTPTFIPQCDLVATFCPSQEQAYTQLAPSSCAVKNLGYTLFPTWHLTPRNPIQSGQALATTLGTTLIKETTQEGQEKTAKAHLNTFAQGKEGVFVGSEGTTSGANDSIGTHPTGSTSEANGSTVTYAVGSGSSPTVSTEESLSRDGATADFLSEIRILDNQHLSGTITLLSPEFDQGLALFTGLVMQCALYHPELNFVLMNSPSATAAKNLAKLHTQDGKKLYQLQPNLQNLKILSFTKSIYTVLAQTKVLLHLPLGGSVEALPPLNATWQGIKVLTLDTPALTEPLVYSIPEHKQDKAFATILVPSSTQADHTCLPREEELKPIMQALEQLLATEHTALSYDEQSQQIQANISKWQQALCDYLPAYKQAALHQVYKLI